MTTETRGRQRVNAIGLEFTDYKGSPTTLCQGCGHNSIANQIIQVAYEMNIRPDEIIKLSGIGCLASRRLLPGHARFQRPAGACR